MSFANNVKSSLESAISATVTRVRVLKAVSPMADVPASGKLTIADSLSNPTAIEIIEYATRTDQGAYWTLTNVTRGAEGSAANSFAIGAIVFQAFTAGDATNATPLEEPNITYVDNQITRIDYSGGEFKVFSYNADGSLNMVALTRAGGATTTKTLNYTNGALTSVSGD